MCCAVLCCAVLCCAVLCWLCCAASECCVVVRYVCAIRSALLLSSQVAAHSNMLSGFSLLLKVPTVQDATVVVSLDRRGKKTTTAVRRLPVANFRGDPHIPHRTTCSNTPTHTNTNAVNAVSRCVQTCVLRWWWWLVCLLLCTEVLVVCLLLCCRPEPSGGEVRTGRVEEV